MAMFAMQHHGILPTYLLIIYAFSQ